MEIPNVRVFCPKGLGHLDPEVFRQGIEQRMELLTYLLCPEDEKDPAEVLQRIRIEPVSPDVLKIRYRVRGSKYPLCVNRFVGEEFKEQVSMAEFGLSRYPRAKTRRAKAILSKAIDCVGFALSPVDRRGMGWPLAIAAAAKFAELGCGAIDTNDMGWLLPAGNEVSWLVKPLGGEWPLTSR
jgi:hypothetical protein